MPEFSKEQTATRKQIDPRDFFSWSVPNLKVTAHPTDPYVKPGVDPNTAAFVDSMKNIEAATGGYVTLQKAFKADNVQRAETDARTGKPEDDQANLFNAGLGYHEAYNITVGEDRGMQYHDELLQGLKDHNHFQNEPDPDAAYQTFNNDLYAKHFTTVHDNAPLMFGASGQIEKAVHAGAVAMHEANVKTAKEAYINSSSRVQQGMLSDYARGDHSEESAQRLRKLLSEEWERVKPTGFMTRDEYSTAVVNNIGTVALKLAQDPSVPTSEAYGNALKLADLFDVPDSDTKQSYATMMDKEGKYKFRSEVDHFLQRLHTILSDRETHDHKVLKLRQDAETKDLFVNVVLNPNLSYEEKQGRITANKYIDHTEMENLVGKAEVFHKEEKNIIQNYPVINNLRERIEMATSADTLQTLRREVIKGYGVHLNSKTSEELETRITGRIDHLKSEARADKQLSLEERKLGYDNLQRVVGARLISDMDGMAGALRMDTYGRMYFNRVNAGESPMEASRGLIDYFSKTADKTASDVHGASKYPTEESIRDAVKSGRIHPDEGILELQKFRSRKRKPQAPAPKEQPGIVSRVLSAFEDN